ncbi:MAG: Hsp70 family protein [Hyphomonadaceae bacterium]|nr:Hsp70 family protein [Hyphomonadaceae bacterium]
MTEWTLCLDFGTAYSKAAAAPTGAWARFDPATVRPLMLAGEEAETNPFLLESAVFVDDQQVLFGSAAVQRADQFSGGKRRALRSFKTLLSVSDLDRALATNVPGSIDPHRLFQMRDLIVLYLAYLLAAINRAAGQDGDISQATGLKVRYAAPAWRDADSAGTHASILRLFGEAEALRNALGKKLLSPEGLSMALVTKAVPKAMAAPEPLEMSLIFEAPAAAAYTSIGLRDAGSHFIVVDMGAGTTDIAGLVRDRDGIQELADARYTLKQAGDFLDGIIANRVLKAASWARGTEAQTALWAMLMRQMADVKETLFAEGRVSIRAQGRGVTVAMRDIERDQDFREFIKTLEHAYEHSIAVVRGDALVRGRAEVEAIAVGGGAAAPFIQALVKQKYRGKPRVTARPATPDWAHAPVFAGNLAPVFPQLAIAIGGALAPDEMLAVNGGGVRRLAAGRNDTQAARD